MNYEHVTNSSTGAQVAIRPQVSRLLALPVEIQLQIYRDAWTFALQDEEEPEDWDYTYNGGPRTALLRKQLSTISAMGAICREMRSHVLAEFFSRTQTHVITDGRVYSSKWILDDIASKRIMRASILLREQLQHVRLVWSYQFGTIEEPTIVKQPARARFALRWLRVFKRLKTLEVVFDLGNLPTAEVDGAATTTWSFEPQGGVPEYIRRLPRMDKVVVSWFAGGQSAERRQLPTKELESLWEQVPQLKEIEERFAKLAAVSSKVR